MKRPLKIILITNSLVILAGALLGPIYAIYVEEIGGDILTVGSTYAIFSIVAGTVIIFLGKIEDKIKNKKRLVIGAYFLLALGFFGYLLVKSPMHLFLIQIIIGIGQAIYIPALDVLYDKNIESRKAAYQWGLWEGIYYIIGGVAAFIGAWVANIYGFSILFIFMGILCVMSAIGMIILPKKF